MRNTDPLALPLSTAIRPLLAVTGTGARGVQAIEALEDQLTLINGSEAW